MAAIFDGQPELDQEDLRPSKQGSVGEDDSNAIAKLSKSQKDCGLLVANRRINTAMESF